MIQRIKLLWQPIPLPYKIGGVVVVIALLIYATNRVSNYYSDRKFEKAIQVEKDGREIDKKRADDAEAHIEILKAEKVKGELALELAGERGKVAVAKVEEAQRKFEDEENIINADADECVRYNRIRARLNLPAKPCE
jgi:hypothetical protein